MTCPVASTTQMFPCGSTRTECAPHDVHPGGSVHRRISGTVWRPVRLGNAGDLALADQPIAPRAKEFAARVEFENRVRATVQHEHSALLRDRHARRLNEVPGSGRTRSVCRRRRKLHELVGRSFVRRTPKPAPDRPRSSDLPPQYSSQRPRRRRSSLGTYVLRAGH